MPLGNLIEPELPDGWLYVNSDCIFSDSKLRLTHALCCQPFPGIPRQRHTTSSGINISCLLHGMIELDTKGIRVPAKGE
jgi:hypothetical protein